HRRSSPDPRDAWPECDREADESSWFLPPLRCLVRFGILRRRVQVLVPTAAFELKRGGRDQSLELELLAGRALLQRCILDRLERLELVLAGFAAILVGGHAPYLAERQDSHVPGIVNPWG